MQTVTPIHTATHYLVEPHGHTEVRDQDLESAHSDEPKRESPKAIEVKPECPERKIKIPPVDLLYWVLKILATTLGESLGDLFSMTIEMGYWQTSLIWFGICVVTIIIQMFVKDYHPLVYWSVITATSTAGTALSDFLDRTCGLGYWKGVLVLLGILIFIFTVWKLLKESFNVQQTQTRRAEVLYWAAIIVSNTLGTALGDFLSHTSKLGYLYSWVLITSILALMSVPYILKVFIRCYGRQSKKDVQKAIAVIDSIPGVVVFWIAFVLTRPFGATLGDILTKDVDEGGVGIGTEGTSALLGSVLAAGVIFACLLKYGAFARMKKFMIERNFCACCWRSTQ